MSKFLNLNLLDLLKGLIVAVGAVVLTGIYAIVIAGHFPAAADWHTILLSGAAAGLSYIIKNFFSNSQSVPMKPEPTDLTPTAPKV